MEHFISSAGIESEEEIWFQFNLSTSKWTEWLRSHHSRIRTKFSHLIDCRINFEPVDGSICYSHHIRSIYFGSEITVTFKESKGRAIAKLSEDWYPITDSEKWDNHYDASHFYVRKGLSLKANITISQLDSFLNYFVPKELLEIIVEYLKSIVEVNDEWTPLVKWIGNPDYDEDSRMRVLLSETSK